ncbi:hypothetical protein EBB07_17380 [Paenibacillaceae bacterium]|nr:hypothetical protein EBB07_17380 [Paenibacillaceae bacterium]
MIVYFDSEQVVELNGNEEIAHAAAQTIAQIGYLEEACKTLPAPTYFQISGLRSVSQELLHLVGSKAAPIMNTPPKEPVSEVGKSDKALSRKSIPNQGVNSKNFAVPAQNMKRSKIKSDVTDVKIGDLVNGNKSSPYWNIQTSPNLRLSVLDIR